MKTIIESRDCTTCTETNCFFKQNAKTDWLEIIGAQKQTFVYKKGDVIFTEGEIMNGVYSIHYGAVKEVIQGSLDEEIISFSFNGMLVGYRGLGAGKNVFRSTAIALSDTELVYFPLPKFQLALHSNPMMMQSLLNLSIDDLNRSESKARFMMRASAEDKIVQVLSYLVKVFGFCPDLSGKLRFTPSRKDIVNYSGLTYETVTRTLNQFVRDGSLQFLGKEFILLKPARFTES